MGGQSAPRQPSPQEQAAAQIQIEQERARIQAEQAAEERERLRREEEETRARLAPQHSAAYDQAYNYLDRGLAMQGIDRSIADQYGISDMYYGALDDARLGIDPLDTNPYLAYNTRTNFNDALSAGRNQYRGDLRSQLNSFAGDGFEYDIFRDTADDHILEAILGQQRDDAIAAFDRALARGQLNDTGYSRAQSDLEGAWTTGLADLNAIGGGVLSGYRNSLAGYRDNQLNRIGSLMFSDDYSMDSVQRRLDDMISGYQGSMEGDIRRAIGNQTFIDPHMLIGGAGAAQGYYNPAAPGTGGTVQPFLASPMDDEESRQQAQAATGNKVF